MVSIDGTDISGATIDGTEVQEITMDGDVVWTAKPDSVVSRPTDDNTTTNETRRAGLVVETKTEWPSIGSRISANTSGATRAYLYRDDDPSDDTEITLIADVDISGLNSGDAFTFDDVNLPSGNQYWITLDAEADIYDRGWGPQTSYPITTDDIDIVGRVLDGNRTNDVPTAVNDIGDVGLS